MYFIFKGKVEPQTPATPVTNCPSDAGLRADGQSFIEPEHIRPGERSYSNVPGN